MTVVLHSDRARSGQNSLHLLSYIIGRNIERARYWPGEIGSCHRAWVAFFSAYLGFLEESNTGTVSSGMVG